VHTHRNEDEYSLVLEGTICVEVGGQTFEAGPGSVVAKPRGVPHAFSNATHFLSREATARESSLSRDTSPCRERVEGGARGA
jgi:quercetin dioxygenase-like cupin family protein